MPVHVAFYKGRARRMHHRAIDTAIRLTYVQKVHISPP